MAATTTFNDAWSTESEPATGGWKKAFSKVKEKLFNKFSSYPAATDIWVGIASTTRDGCEQRWNEKYKDMYLDYMAPLYQTTSDDFRKKMESQIITWCQEKQGNQIELENEIKGGGGPVGKPPYYVYVAFRKNK